MPYTETHEITIGPITLPAGVMVDVKTTVGTGGLDAVTITGSTPSSKADTVALLQAAFAALIVAASAEGVGAPVFQSPVAPLPPAPSIPPVAS
jgi:uncharacterized phosphosugar-binding protein